MSAKIVNLYQICYDPIMDDNRERSEPSILEKVARIGGAAGVAASAIAGAEMVKPTNVSAEELQPHNRIIESIEPPKYPLTDIKETATPTITPTPTGTPDMSPEGIATKIAEVKATGTAISEQSRLIAELKKAEDANATALAQQKELLATATPTKSPSVTPIPSNTPNATATRAAEATQHAAAVSKETRNIQATATAIEQTQVAANGTATIKQKEATATQAAVATINSNIQERENTRGQSGFDPAPVAEGVVGLGIIGGIIYAWRRGILGGIASRFSRRPTHPRRRPPRTP